MVLQQKGVNLASAAESVRSSLALNKTKRVKRQRIIN